MWRGQGPRAGNVQDMPVAYLPSPASAVWHLGVIPVRAYALCRVTGVVAALWVTNRRYRRAGGQAGGGLNLATVPRPGGLGGRARHGVRGHPRRCGGPRRGWTSTDA